MVFTGNVIDGRTAAAWGLTHASVPSSHLAMHKMVANQVLRAMGLEQSQQMATLFDGITRHNPEGLWF